MVPNEEDLRPPAWPLLLLEPGRAVAELGSYYLAWPLLRSLPRGDGHPVLILPGLGAGDLSTRPLRRFLRALGYWVHAWKLGRNTGDPGLIDPLARRLHGIGRRHGRKVSLIGWSLGGLYAREVAKAAAADVRQVITLGTPFTGSQRASNAVNVYEALSGRAAENPELLARLRIPPPVPTTSIYSRSDGIVAWQCSVERNGLRTENIEIHSSHLGLGCTPPALYAIADRIAQPEGTWKPFAPPGPLRLLYGTPGR